MFRQSPSRNHRSRGFKVKHVLQICLLLAVCFWLIYQVKHSHDKKKEFDEKQSEVSAKSTNGDEILKFGRKELRPKEDEVIAIEHEKESEGGEESEGDEGNKHEEDEQEEEEGNKSEERETGDDEIDEGDQDDKLENDEDFIDEEKEREEVDEEKDGQVETEDQDLEAGGRNTHEAREENYKGDDASSAVAHDTEKIIATEIEKLKSENSSTENLQKNILERTEQKNNTNELISSGLKVVGGEKMAENGKSLNGTASEERGELPLNSMITTEASDKSEAKNNQTEVGSQENSFLPPKNVKETILSSNESQNETTATDLSSVSNSSNSSAIEVKSSDSSVSTKESDNDSTQNGKLDTDNGTEHDDPIDTSDSVSISQDETEARTDLDTLPEIRTEGSRNVEEERRF